MPDERGGDAEAGRDRCALLRHAVVVGVAQPPEVRDVGEPDAVAVRQDARADAGLNLVKAREFGVQKRKVRGAGLRQLFAVRPGFLSFCSRGRNATRAFWNPPAGANFRTSGLLDFWTPGPRTAGSSEVRKFGRSEVR